MTGRLVLDVVGVRVEVPSGEDVPAEDLYAAAAAVAIERAPRLLLHTGAVARDGRAVLFPGESGTGKSTMVAACLRRGFGYLSDELVAVEPDTGHVTGWARPLMLTSWALGAVGLDVGPLGAEEKAAVPPERLGAATVAATVPVAQVVELRRGAARTRLTPRPAGEVLAQVLRAGFNHYRLGADAWTAATALARGARGWRLDVAGLDEAADVVAELA
ncbi:hypothetical protein [Jiangella anatolica]|uniref:Serine kinase n=1 Tax=Jiangella anatolica TaxID=2670374 RepID=A0A2W2BZC5_9ACTN|nr:hypothetical protein [Jiangella anatolica]PZF81017.1 hypothetical protein C1I92_23195 [Jiangella anatolica]